MLKSYFFLLQKWAHHLFGGFPFCLILRTAFSNCPKLCPANYKPETCVRCTQTQSKALSFSSLQLLICGLSVPNSSTAFAVSQILLASLALLPLSFCCGVQINTDANERWPFIGHPMTNSLSLASARSKQIKFECTFPARPYFTTNDCFSFEWHQIVMFTLQWCPLPAAYRYYRMPPSQ